jgi:hypothetical protein
MTHKIPCACGGMRDSRARFCRKCSHGGRRSSSDREYAKELGITRRRLVSLGGADHLKAMTADARAILLGSGKPGNSHTLLKGGLAARGFLPQLPGRITQPPLELLMSEEDFASLGVK